MPSTSN
jgi:nucleosome binding factor SPN SPT16 subunit